MTVKICNENETSELGMLWRDNSKKIRRRKVKYWEKTIQRISSSASRRITDVIQRIERTSTTNTFCVALLIGRRKCSSTDRQRHLTSHVDLLIISDVFPRVWKTKAWQDEIFPPSSDRPSRSDRSWAGTNWLICCIRLHRLAELDFMQKKTFVPSSLIPGEPLIFMVIGKRCSSRDDEWKEKELAIRSFFRLIFTPKKDLLFSHRSILWFIW